MRSTLKLTAAIGLLFLASNSAQGESGARTYIVLDNRCTASNGRAVLERSSSRTYYPYVGDESGRRFTACASGSGWGVVNDPGCQGFNLASYRITCFGGELPAPQFYAGNTDVMRSFKLSLQGNALAIAMQPAVVSVPLVFGGSRQALERATRIIPLQTGYAPVPEPVFGSPNLCKIEWDETNRSPAMKVEGPTTLPALPTPAPVSRWVDIIGSPWVYVPALAAALAYALVAAAGYPPSTRQRQPSGRGRLAVLALLALAGIYYAGQAKHIPERDLAVAKEQLTRTRAQLQALATDRAELRRITHDAGGRLIPLADSTMQRVRALTAPRVITVPTLAGANPETWATAYLVPLLLLVLFYVHRVIVGAHYLFVPHPAGRYIEPALASGRGFTDAERRHIRDVVTPNRSALENPPPAYVSDHMAEKAEALTARLAADADLATQAARRDVAIAEARDAQKRIDEMQTKSRKR